MRREILIDGATAETRVALIEDDVLTEVSVERRSSRGIAGNIYKGQVSHVLPGMQAAFVDIGTGRDAFLYVRDLTGGIEDDDLPAGGEAETPADAARAQPAPARIEDLLTAGQEILVQVAKDPVPEKGARLTSLVSLPGRFLVYLPTLAHIGVSRRIEDPPERERLKELAQSVTRDLNLTGGFIVRTAGAGRSHGDLAPDARILASTWDEVRGRSESAPAPALVHQEVGVVTKLLRDVLGEDLQQIVVDGKTAYEETVEQVRRIEPAMAGRVCRHAGPEPLFTTRGIEAQLERALRSRIWLKSGGSIVIQATEALVAIDVNTGKYVGTRRLEETVLRTNLEAGAEIVRQIRLRDLGGIIVIDFIDMEEQASKDRLLAALQAELRRDRSKSRVLELSEFGLVEITRQRTKPSLERLLCRPCPSCAGSGRLKTPETLVFEILREALRMGPLDPGARVVAHVHPDVAASLGPGHAELAEAVARLAPARLEIAADAALRHEKFSLTVRVPEG
jgi:ribonuclease G